MRISSIGPSFTSRFWVDAKSLRAPVTSEQALDDIDPEDRAKYRRPESRDQFEAYMQAAVLRKESFIYLMKNVIEEGPEVIINALEDENIDGVEVTCDDGNDSIFDGCIARNYYNAVRIPRK